MVERTPEQIDVMTLLELRVECARAMGWTEIASPPAANELQPAGIPPLGHPLRASVDRGGIKVFLPDYPNDMAAAMDLARHVQTEPGGMFFLEAYYGQGYKCLMLLSTYAGCSGVAFATDPAVAICRAFLKTAFLSCWIAGPHEQGRA
jgi:hypothetical protein